MSQWALRELRKENICHLAVIRLLPTPYNKPWGKEAQDVKTGYWFQMAEMLVKGVVSVSQTPTTSHMCVCARSVGQLCPTLCNPIDGSPPGSPIPGILQARILEWAAISFSNAWKWNVKVKSLSRVWLPHPMDCSLPGSSVHGIFQAPGMPPKH